jgi:hypothetical protein
MKSQVTLFFLVFGIFIAFALFLFTSGSVDNTFTSPDLDFLALEEFISSCVKDLSKSHFVYYGLDDFEYEVSFIFEYCFNAVVNYTSDRFDSYQVDVALGNYSLISTPKSAFLFANQPLTLGNRDHFLLSVEVPVVSSFLVQTDVDGKVIRDTILVSPDDLVRLLIRRDTMITDELGNSVVNPVITVGIVQTGLFEGKWGLIDYQFLPEGLRFSNSLFFQQKVDIELLNDLDLNFNSFVIEHLSSSGSEIIDARFDEDSSSIRAEVYHFSNISGRGFTNTLISGNASPSQNSRSCENLNYDNSPPTPCPAGWSNCDCSGHCGTEGMCPDAVMGGGFSSNPESSCQNTDFNTGGSCPPGRSNCDCNGDCGTSGACGTVSATFNPGTAGPSGSSLTSPAPTSSTLGSPGSRSGFVWKPISESNRKLVVLLPRSYRRQVQSVGIYSSTGNLIESGRFAGDTHNGNRPHYRFSKSGAGYGSEIYVVATLNSGGKVHWRIPNGARRVG